MKNTFKNLLKILSSREKRFAFLLFIPIVLSGIVNAFGVAFLLPFIAIISKPDVIHKSKVLLALYQYGHFNSYHSFLIFLGVTVFIILVAGNTISGLTLSAILKFTNQCGEGISNRLFQRYLLQPYSFYLQRNSSELNKNILSMVDTVVRTALRQGFEMLMYSVSALFILLMLLAINYQITLILGAIFGGAYVLIYKYVKKWLAKADITLTDSQRQLYKMTSEAFGSIKYTLIRNCQKFLQSEFKPHSKSLYHSTAISQIIAQSPKFLLEIIAFGGMVLVITFMLIKNYNFNNILPLLAVFAFAGYRLLPSVQQIFGCYTSIQAHQSALNDLAQELTLPISSQHQHSGLACQLSFRKEIVLEEVFFQYSQNSKMALNNINLCIPYGNSVAFVGKTGSGKTTLVDLLMGLLSPTMGNILIDSTPLCTQNLLAWQAKIGYVPQHIFLTDHSIAHNIAFGSKTDDIDLTKVKTAAQIACLDDFITSELPDQYNTIIGEKGGRLSGGQIQRIGIARALYHDPDIIVLDEATSALDPTTEASVIHNICSLHKTLIIIAHKANTIKHCNKIFILDQGRIIDEGSYDQLSEQSPHFQFLTLSDNAETL